MVTSLAFVTLSIIALIKRRGIDFITLTVIGFVAYYYPLLVFDKLVWLSNGVNSSTISVFSRYAAWTLFLLYVFWGYCQRRTSFNSDWEINSEHHRIMWVLFFISLIFCLRLYQLVAGLNDFDKIELMRFISYELKLFEASVSLYFIVATYSKNKFHIFMAIIFAIFEISIGFRFLLLQFLLIYLFLNPAVKLKGIFAAAGLISLVFFVVIFSKLFFYRIPSPMEVAGILENQFSSDSLQDIVSIANSESTGISVVFNEIISEKFSLSEKYFLELLSGFVPFARYFFSETGMGFAAEYKSALQADGLESLASSAYALGFSVFGVLGLGIFFILHIFLIRILFKSIKRSTSVLARLLSVHILILFMGHAHRNDLIFTITQIKSALAIIFIVFFIIFLLRFQRLPNRQDVSSQAFEGAMASK
jgi:hypothetical protein